MYTMLKKFALFTLGFLGANLLLWWFAGSFVTLNALHAHYAQLSQFIAQHYYFSVALYLAAYAIEAFFFLPIAIPLLLAGGLMFGILPTVLYATIGACTGGTLGFLAARYLFGSFVQERYQTTLATFNEHLRTKGALYVAIARLVPIIPFSLVNILAGVSLIPLTRFIGATIVGMIPGALMYAYLGNTLATIESFTDLLTFDVLVPFLTFKACVILIMLSVQTRKNPATSSQIS